MDERRGTLNERDYTPKLAGLDDIGSSLITLTVNLGAYRDNLRTLCALASPAKLIHVVKANAYGLGAAGLTPILSEFTDEISLGVANADEALELKATGYPGRIVLLGYTHPKNYYQIIQSGCQLAAYRPENIPPLAEACRQLGHPLKLHIKVDTGMARLGVPVAELAAFIRELKRYPEIEVVGLFSHMVDSGVPSAQINIKQAERFKHAIEIAETELGYHPECHLANSGALLNFPDLRLDSVRVGALAFGYRPPGDWDSETPVKPCLKLASEVIDIHELTPGQGVSYSHSFTAGQPTRVATMPFGYADGMFPALANNADVLIRGQRYPLRGNVTMDYVMAEIGEAEIAIGDEVVFVGQQGESEVSIDEVAKLAGVLNYEVSCAWGRRVRRVYVED